MRRAHRDATHSNSQLADSQVRHAFSGGRDTVEEHRALGANLEIDVPYKYLQFFMEDDARLAEIAAEYGSGRMLTGEIKKILVEVLVEQVEQHKRARALITEDIVDAFMAVRALNF